MVERWSRSWRHHTHGWSMPTGLNSEVHGAEVAVAQWRVPERRSETQDAVVWLEATTPPAWTQGAPRPPWTGDQWGDCPAPWWRRARIRSSGPLAAQPIGSVVRRRLGADATQVRTRSPCE